MNPGRYFMPSMGMNPMMHIAPSIGMRPMMTANYLNPRNLGLFSRIGNTLRSFNWRGLLSGANRTLNVVNQTIPLIRQAKPMFNNVKSMLQLAKAFGNETSNKKNSNNYTVNRSKENNVFKKDNKESILNEKKINFSQNDNLPTFFL